MQHFVLYFMEYSNVGFHFFKKNVFLPRINPRKNYHSNLLFVFMSQGLGHRVGESNFQPVLSPQGFISIVVNKIVDVFE